MTSKKTSEGPFTTLIKKVITLLDPSAKHVLRIYSSNYKFFNYAFVCGAFGISINQLVLHGLVTFMPLYLANFLAILSAWTINYAFTVGPFGYLFGLSEQVPLRKPKEAPIID